MERSAEKERICHDFIDTGRCEHTDAEHDAIADGQPAESDAALIERAAEALRTSRLSWGTHGDRRGDAEWQREFWTEAATIALRAASVIPPEVTEADT